MTAKQTTMQKLKQRREQRVADTMTWQQKVQFNLNVIAEHLGVTLTVGAFNPTTNEYASLVCAGSTRGVTKDDAVGLLRKVGEQMIADAGRIDSKPVTLGDVVKESADAAAVEQELAKKHGPYCYAEHPDTPGLFCAELHGHPGTHEFERGCR